MKSLRVVKELCNGCRMCEIMCSLNKIGVINRYAARIRVLTSVEGIHSPVVCRHCENPQCLAACPIPGAMCVHDEMGTVVVDDEKCTECLACVSACPFYSIWQSPDGQILKCDLCGGDPVCVRYCPPRPEHSMPHLPWEEQSCLQYADLGALNASESQQG